MTTYTCGHDGPAGENCSVCEPPVDPIIRDHLNWIVTYCELTTAKNYRDMLDRIQHQIRMAQQDAVTL